MTGNCCCSSNCRGQAHGHGRRYLTKTERIEKLKNYTQELKKEIAAVEEHIQELSK
jgi:hypothetical protein